MEKCIWIVGAPRSASMWTFNVTRQILLRSGFNVFPETVPQHPVQTISAADAALRDSDGRNIWVLKLHGMVKREAPRSCFIVTKRDLRDALVSFMRFTGYNFERSLAEMVDAAKNIERYQQFDNALHLSYEDITQNPYGAGDSIAQFLLGTPLSPDGLEDCIAQFDADKVKGLINRAERKLQELSKNGKPIPENSFVPNSFGPGIGRAFDPKTGFQSGHISNGHDWKVALTADQQCRVQLELGDWLERNGYA